MSEIATVGNNIAGFTVTEIVELSELNAHLCRLEHNKTGAQLIWLINEDDNNLFGVTFRTTPQDSTGVAHILEHTVLCGSENFPVRDPFFSMLKRSLNTFMNALTSSDWTMYPFSSQNQKDFDNLLDIYLDASFFPLLRERDFGQEGHRLEFSEPENPSSPLEYKGVVYNEMKGAMADPSSLIGRSLYRALFPTVTYGNNSGGEPADIPNLTWEELKAFHARYYHPTNSYLFLYGDLDLEDKLQKIDAVLSRFERLDFDTSVPDEKRYTEPQTFREPFQIDQGESKEGRSIVQVGWLNSPIDNSLDRLSMKILASLLVGDQATPLYRALIDSGLGSNLAPASGYHDDIKETCFAVGLQGTEPDRDEEIEKLILKTLEEVAETGFSKERIESVIHRIEIGQREVSGDGYPYSLNLLFRMIGPWMHGDDPTSALLMDNDLQTIKKATEQGNYFGDLIRKQFLDNPHRVRLLLYPDEEVAQREEAAEKAKLEKIQHALSVEERGVIIAQAKELQSAQEEEEDLSCLPTLEISDIPASEVDISGGLQVGTPLSVSLQPTNGLGYFAAHFDLSELDAELMPWVPLFGTMFGNVAAGGKSYTEVAEDMAAYTGGISASATLLQKLDTFDQYRPVLALRGKALNRNSEHLFRIMNDLLRSQDFSDRERLHTLINQVKASMENSIPGAGHSFAARVAASGLSAAGVLREEWRGIAQIRRIREIASRPTDQMDELAENFNRIASYLVERAGVSSALIGEKSFIDDGSSKVSTLLSGYNQVARTGVAGSTQFVGTSMNAGFSTSVPVAYVAKTIQAVPYNDPANAGLCVLAKLLRAEYLHREIREKGGAYGGFASFDSESGNFSFLSYRDPHIDRTLQVYRDSAEWAATGKFTDESIKEAILSVFGDMDKPLSPNGRGYSTFADANQGLTKEMRQEYREKILAVDRSKLTQISEEILLGNWAEGSVAVIAGSQMLEESKVGLKVESL